MCTYCLWCGPGLGRCLHVYVLFVVWSWTEALFTSVGTDCGVVRDGGIDYMCK